MSIFNNLRAKIVPQIRMLALLKKMFPQYTIKAFKLIFCLLGEAMQRTAVREKMKYTILYKFGSLAKFCSSCCYSYTNLMRVLHGKQKGSELFWENVREACNIDPENMPEIMSDSKFEDDLTPEEKAKLAKILFKCGTTPGAILKMLDMSTEDLDKVFKVSR